MRKLILLVIAITCASSTTRAQQADSLNKIFIEDRDPATRLAVLEQLIDYYKKEYPDTVIAVSNELLSLARQTNDSVYQFKALNLLGVSYASRGDLEQSLQHLLKALAIAEGLHDLKRISAIYNNLSYIYFVQKMYDKAFECLDHTLEIDQKLGDRKAEGITLNNMGIMYRGLAKFDEAEQCYKKALAVGYETRNDTAIANTLGNFADLYYEQGKYQQSLAQVTEALKVSRRARLDYITCIFTLSKARTFGALNRYEQAIAVADSALTLARQNGYMVHLKQGYGILTDLHTSRGDYKQALEAYHTQVAYQDSIVQKEKMETLAELEARFDTKIKSMRIARLESEKNLQQTITYWAIAAAILLCVGLVLVYFTLSLRNALLKKKNQALETEQKIAQLENEKLQMGLDYKNRQVVANAMLVAQKNEMLAELKERVKNIATRKSEDVSSELKSLQREINSSLELADDWEQIKLHFEEVAPRFFDHLLNRFPGLTLHEQKLCVYIRMKLSNKEISRLLNIAPESVKMLRYRLRKKMMLPEEENIQELLQQI